jgi:hypothetical protein
VKKGVFYYIVFIILSSCTRYPSSDEAVVGKYYSMSDKKENYFFEFYRDKTYKQILLNQNDTVLISKGNWQLVDDKGLLDC